MRSTECHSSIVKKSVEVPWSQYIKHSVVCWWCGCADVLKVNGLSVDWVSSHIYWTDARKRTVEVAEFDGTNRRILITERLSQPRGIYADPVNGFVSWRSPLFLTNLNLNSNRYAYIVTMTIRRAFDGRSTAYQRSLVSQWRNPLAAVTLTYLFI